MPSSPATSKTSQSQILLQTHELAITAMTRIEAHEAECNRREEARVRWETQFLRQYEVDIGEIKRGLEQVHGRISGLGGALQSLVRGTGGTLIVGLCGLVAWLVLNGRPWE